MSTNKSMLGLVVLEIAYGYFIFSKTSSPLKHVAIEKRGKITTQPLVTLPTSEIKLSFFPPQVPLQRP